MKGKLVKRKKKINKIIKKKIHDKPLTQTEKKWLEENYSNDVSIEVLKKEQKKTNKEIRKEVRDNEINLIKKRVNKIQKEGAHRTPKFYKNFRQYTKPRNATLPNMIIKETTNGEKEYITNPIKIPKETATFYQKLYEKRKFIKPNIKYYKKIKE